MLIAVTLCTLSPRLGVVIMVGVELLPVLHVVTEEFDSSGTLVSANIANTECDDDSDNTTLVYSNILFIPADDIALTDNRIVSPFVATDEDRIVSTCVVTDKGWAHV